jgi:hypothetical protein
MWRSVDFVSISLNEKKAASAIRGGLTFLKVFVLKPVAQRNAETCIFNG